MLLKLSVLQGIYWRCPVVACLSLRWLLHGLCSEIVCRRFTTEFSLLLFFGVWSEEEKVNVIVVVSPGMSVFCVYWIVILHLDLYLSTPLIALEPDSTTGVFSLNTVMERWWTWSRIIHIDTANGYISDTHIIVFLMRHYQFVILSSIFVVDYSIEFLSTSAATTRPTPLPSSPNPHDFIFF